MAAGSQLRVLPPLETNKEREMESISYSVFNTGKAGYPGLHPLNKLPKWFRSGSNPYIYHGYRHISRSAHSSLCSLFYVHNESFNIYSHLIPAILFLLGEWHIQQYLTNMYSGVTGADLIAFSIFMLTAVTCLTLSAAYHIFMNHSQHVEHLCLRLDMLGIVVFILGDLALGIYMIFWCGTLARNLYWSLVSSSQCAKFSLP